MDTIKSILIFGAGAAAGFVVGKFYFEKKFELERQKDRVELRNYYDEKLKKMDNEISRSDKLNDKIEEVIEETKKVEHIQDKVNYNKIGKEEEIVKAEMEAPEEDHPNKPYIISEDEFLDGNNEYDKISLTYFIMDDTLADDSEEVVDIEETISTDIYNMLGDDADDKDLYVRNDDLQTDFEIMKVEGSYSERMGFPYR